MRPGKPVVIAPLPEYEPMREVLRIARSRDGFLALIQDALDETATDAPRRRQAAVSSGTWDARAEQVSGLIEEALRHKGSAVARNVAY